MVGTSGRSYFTYKQIVVRAIVELEQDENGGSRHGRSYHTKTLHNKIRDFAQAEDVHLGDKWSRRITKASAALLEEGVLRKTKQRGHIALAPKGKKRLAASRQRYGSLDELSPFKKSQFLKPVTVTSTPDSSRSSISSPNATKTNLSWQCKSQERLIASLRAALGKAENANKSVSSELEETRRERDDLELSLRDMERPPTPPFESNSIAGVRASPGLTLRFDPQTTSTPHQSHSEPTVPSDRASSPAPIPTRPSSPIAPLLAKRPITAFMHRPSGSFLNTVSNQFTPSPSPGPIVSIVPDNATAAGSSNPVNDGESSDDEGDFGATDFGYADMGGMDVGFENDPTVERRMDVDSEAVQQKEAQLRDALNKTQDLEAQLAIAEKNATALTTTLQQLAAVMQEHDSLAVQFGSMTQERDALHRGKLELEATLQDREQQIGSLHDTLTATVQERDILHAENTSLHVQLVALDHARATAESEGARVSAELEHRALEVTALNVRVGTRTVELQQSNAQRDDANARLQSTTFQLKATESLLQNTKAYVAATDAQLKGVQGDLRMVWKELQASNTQRLATQGRFESAQAQLESTHAELDMANARLDSTVSHLESTAAQLQNSNAQLDAANARLEGTRGDLQRIWGEFQASNVEHVATEAQLETTNAELEATNAHLNGTQNDLQQAWRDLQIFDAELTATNVQLTDAKVDLHNLWADLKLAHDREQGFKTQLQGATAQLDATRSELEQAINKAADRERYLGAQLEDAQERVAIAQEDLERVKAAWVKAEEKKRIAAEEMKRAAAEAADADEEVHQMLFSSAGPKREASIRDSGISIAM